MRKEAGRALARPLTETSSNTQPKTRELNKLPRNFIVCVAATVVGEDFYRFIRNAINERNAQVTREKNLEIAINPQLAEAFHASTAVSRKLHARLSNLFVVSKGIGANMLKTQSKRRRTK